MSGQQQNIRHREPPSQTRTIQSPKDGDSSTSGDELSTRIVQISLLTNLGLAGIKLVGGWIFKSKSLSADGWHSLTDLATDVLALATILVSSMLKAIDLRKSTVGHVERSMSLLASGLLVMLGVHMAWESGTALGTQLIGRPAHVDSVPLDLDNDTQSMQAMWVAVLTILVKEWLYHATIKVANEGKSSVLASNAVHQRADSLMSMVTIAAIFASNVLTDMAWIDSIGGLGISAIVVHAVLRNLTSTLN